MAIREDEFYPTPFECYNKLPIDWSLFATALEPCKGDGRLVTFLEEKGVPCEWAELSLGIDYFAKDYKVDLILTNPPFSKALQFFNKAIKEANTVIMLQRLNYLGSQKRKDWWQTNEPTSLFILSNRPSFTGKGTDSTEYCWYVWDKTERTPRGIFHI